MIDCRHLSMNTVTVMRDVPAELLAQRRRIGADRWDEVWNEVWHLVPNPGLEHQRLQIRLSTWLLTNWGRRPGHEVFPGLNVSREGLRSWTSDFRVPDIVLITADRASRMRDTHLAGGPEVTIEIRSTGDESDDKLGFYCEVGTDEIWIVDSHTCACEIFANEQGKPVRRQKGEQDWTVSTFGIEMKAIERRLAIRLSGDPGSQALLP